jgi:hypothetical protein
MPNESIAVKVDRGKVDVRLGHSESPTAVLTGKPELIMKLLAGRMTIAYATARIRVLLKNHCGGPDALANSYGPGGTYFQRSLSAAAGT